MPYFLLFDEEGQLVYQQAGYSSYKKEAFQDSILVALGKKGRDTESCSSVYRLY